MAWSIATVEAMKGGSVELQKNETTPPRQSGGAPGDDASDERTRPTAQEPVAPHWKPMDVRPPIYRLAQVRLRDYIRSNGLTAGDKLPTENVLATALGVSRPSLREATRSLQTLGVIEARPGSGLYVAEFSLRPLIEQLPYGLASPGTSLREVLTVREAMEVGLMPAVCRLITDEHLETAEALHHRMADLEADGESTTKVDLEFHLALYATLDNPLVDNLIELFWELYSRLGAAVPASVVPDHASIHWRIIEALRSRDASLSVQRMQEHFDDVRERVAALGGRGES